jgi:competence protein ComEA
MNMLRCVLLALLFALALPAVALAQVDINHADAKTLAESLSGVGLVKAEAIVAYRNANGPFRSVEELARVKGIGAKTIDANRDAIVIVSNGVADPAARGGHPKPATR